MKKQFQLCASCRIIGLERGELLFVTKKAKMCNACGSVAVPMQPVDVEVRKRENNEKITVYTVWNAVEPSTETLQTELAKALPDIKTLQRRTSDEPA